MRSECFKKAFQLFFKNLLKSTAVKYFLSFKVVVLDNNDQNVFIFYRRFTFLLSKVFVIDADGKMVAYFKQKILLWRRGFDLFSGAGQFIISIKGDWKDWNFKLLDSQKNQFRVINKIWNGLLKEIFTINDPYSYFVKIEKPISSQEKALILSSAVVIDMVLKEYF